MASSTHKRQNVSTNRPLYRDGKRGKAVKVFTINQESRYLLVHGVPDINITDELIKLFSLYGVIEEYNTIDDDSSAEEFTKTHWIKYADIQAARVAKRKMDDYSFYGGFLHVTYAPEYESIQDTREKLQQRRMDVARRLRKLAQERAPCVDDGIETVHVSSSIEGTNDTHLDRPPPVTVWTSTPPSQHLHVQTVQSTFCGLPSTGQDEINKGSGHSMNEHGAPDQGVPQIPQIPPSLPEPPRRLPPWQWDIPSQPDFPRLRTKHDTLPSGFSPFPERGSQLNQEKTGNLHQTPSSIPAPSSHTFIGPLRPTPGDSIDSTLNSDTVCSSQHGQRYSESGARPKGRFSSSMHSSRNYGTLQKRIDSEQNGKAVDGESIQTDQGQGGCPQADSDVSEREQRPKLVGRRRIGPQPSCSSDQQVNISNSSTKHTSSFASRHAFLPRPVSTRVKRSASSIDEDDRQTESGHQSSPAAEDASFNQTVSSVRQQMLQVSQAGACGTAPRSVIQTAIIQARNRERMGLLPHRPPTKRQRI